MQTLVLAGQQFQRFRNLNGGDDTDYRHDDTGSIASRGAGRRRRFWKNTTQASSLMRPNRHCYAVGTNRGSINPIDLVLDAGVVNQIARGEIIRAIKHGVT